MTRAAVADVIEQFLDGTGGEWDWDDFCSVRIADPELDAIRIRCISFHDEHPSPKGYCSPEGYEVMRGLVKALRQPR
jgi:hypothetical protein